jgi:hypothetical protein
VICPIREIGTVWESDDPVELQAVLVPTNTAEPAALDAIAGFLTQSGLIKRATQRVQTTARR